MEVMDSLRGHLLVASPGLLDPNFRRTVVLVTEHTEEGAAGLVLNRPSPVEVAGAVPQLEPVVDDGEAGVRRLRGLGRRPARGRGRGRGLDPRARAPGRCVHGRPGGAVARRPAP